MLELASGNDIKYSIVSIKTGVWLAFIRQIVL